MCSCVHLYNTSIVYVDNIYIGVDVTQLYRIHHYPHFHFFATFFFYFWHARFAFYPIWRVRSEAWKNHNFNLLYDNAPMYITIFVRQFLVKKKKVPVLIHSVYTTNVSPLDYFVFPELKMKLKGDQYKNILVIQKSMTAKLEAIPTHEWENAMKWLKDRPKEGIPANGDYFQ